MIRVISVMFGDENYTGLATFGQIDRNPEFVLCLAPMVVAMQRAGWDENLKAVGSGLLSFRSSPPGHSRSSTCQRPLLRRTSQESHQKRKIRHRAS